jgi:hypothetical protein
VRFTFKDAKGGILPAQEDSFKVVQSLTRSKGKRGLSVPQGAVSAAVAVGGVEKDSHCEIAHFYFSDKEEGKDK